MKTKKAIDLIFNVVKMLNDINRCISTNINSQAKLRTSETEFALIESHNALSQVRHYLARLIKERKPEYILPSESFLTINKDNSIVHGAFESMENTTVH